MFLRFTKHIFTFQSLDSETEVETGSLNTEQGENDLGVNKEYPTYDMTELLETNAGQEVQEDVPELTYMNTLVDTATQVVFSKPFYLFYLIMIVLNLILLLWVRLTCTIEC